MNVRSLHLVLLLALAGCDGPATAPGADGGEDGSDAGSTTADAGETPRDGGRTGTDGGQIGTDGGSNDVDGGGPPVTTACDALPATLALGSTDDSYFDAAIVCGVPGGACSVRSSAFDVTCGDSAPTILVGYNVIVSTELRLTTPEWTIASSTEGTIEGERVQGIQDGTEASVTIRSPAGAEHTIRFRTDLGTHEVTVSEYAAVE